MNAGRLQPLLPLCALLLCMTLASPGSAGESAPIVRVELTPESLTVGESATMRVTVLVPTWQPVPPVYPTFEVPNAITRLPPDSSHPVSERVGRETWSGIVRNYEVTPLVPASLTLGGEPIRITWANPGAANQVSDIRVPQVSLTARIPPGAEDVDPFLAGRRLELARTFDGDIDRLSVGDGLVVHYRATLDGMPALFLPPLAPALSSDLISVYPKEPVLTDGEHAERLETLTLVLNHGGDLEIPGRILAWWNQAEQRVEQARLEPVTLTIQGPPPEPSEEPDTRRSPWRLLAILLIAALTGLGLRRFLPAFIATRRKARETYRASEAFAFRALLEAETPEAFYRSAVAWLRRLDPTLDLRAFADRYGDQALVAAFDQLSEVLFGAGGSGPDLRTAAKGLRAARGRHMAEVRSGHEARLAPLNPG